MRLHVEQCFSNCGSRTSQLSISRELARNANARAPPQTPGVGKRWGGPQESVVKQALQVAPTHPSVGEPLTQRNAAVTCSSFPARSGRGTRSHYHSQAPVFHRTPRFPVFLERGAREVGSSVCGTHRQILPCSHHAHVPLALGVRSECPLPHTDERERPLLLHMMTGVVIFSRCVDVQVHSCDWLIAI